MPATVTLATLTLAKGIGTQETWITVVSTAGLAIPSSSSATRPTGGYRLYLEGELMDARRIGPGSTVEVIRGVDGTSARPHSSGETIYLGRPDQFYTSDPIGVPSETIEVSPYINAINGTVWYAQGDSLPVGNSHRWWQKVDTTYGIGPLGIRTETENPTSST